MWGHLPVGTLVGLQHAAAIRWIDEQIRVDWEAGYGVDVDALLERRKRLLDGLR